MKNFKFTLWLLVLFMIGWSTQAQEVQIGIGTATNTAFPISANFNYSYSQQIYTQAQLNTAGEISKIRFYYISGTGSKSLDWVIYMGHTPKTSFLDTTDWIPTTSMTEVFNGQVSYPAGNNWMEITLTTPFDYNNIDNLVIAVDENTAGFSTITWRAFTSGANTGMYFRSDSENPDPASPPFAKDLSATLAQVQLYFTESCPAPTALLASNPTHTSIDLAWTNGGTETLWKVKYGAPGFNPETEGTTVDAVSNPFTLPSLAATTSYDVYVKANCAVDDESPWGGPAFFSTLCNPFTTPFVESFESAMAPPVCWSVVYQNTNPSAGNLVIHTGPNATEGDKSFRFSSYTNSPPFHQWLVSPELNYSTEMMVRFNYLKSSNSYSEVIAFGYSTTGSDVSADFTWLPNITDLETGSWKQFETIVPMGTKYVAIKNAPSASWAYVYIDEFKIMDPPTCYKPTDFAVVPSGIFAEFSWEKGLPTDSDWILQYKLVSAPSWTSVNISDDSPFILSGLLPLSDYNARIKTNCGVGDESEYSEIIEFTTLQNPAGLPFIEGFEAGWADWSVINGTQTNQWVIGTPGPGGTQAAFISNDNGITNAYTTGSRSDVHLFRDIQFTADEHFLLSFEWKGMGESSYDFLKVSLVPAGYPIVAGTLIHDSLRIGEIRYNLSNSWTQENIELDEKYTNGTYSLVFSWKNDGSSGNQPPIAVDNIELKVLTCPRPSEIIASNIETEAVTLAWTENGTASEWIIRYGNSGFNHLFDGDGEDVLATSNPFTLNSLDPAFTYDVYIKSNCSTSDNSFWSNKITFSTACNPSVGTWTENFEGVSVPNLPICWSKIVETSSSGDVKTVSSYAPGATTSAPMSVHLTNAYDQSSTIMLVSPEIEEMDLLTLTFKAKAGSNANPIQIGYLTNPTDASTFVLLKQIALTTTYSGYSVPLVDTDTARYFAFKHGNGGSSRTLYIDDVEMIATPACTTPLAQPTALVLNVAGANVSGSFTAAAAVDAYIVVRTTLAAHNQAPVDGQVYAANDVIGNGVVVTYSPTTTFIDSGLSGTTEYFYHVYSVSSQCLNGPSYLGTNPLTASVTTLVPTPVSLVANPTSTNQIDIITAANVDDNNVIIAVNSVNTFGTPTGTYAINDIITSGGTVVYQGPAGTFNHTALTQGTKYFYKVWSVNSTDVYSLAGLTANAITYFTAPYTQDFNAATSMPLAWVGTSFNVSATHGNSSNGLYVNVYSGRATPSVTTPVIVTENDPMRVSFDYRLVNYSNYPNNAFPLTGNDKLELQVSNDLGVTYSTIYTIDKNNHTTSKSFKKIYVAIDHLNFNGPLKFKIQATWAQGDYYLDIDNFLVEENQEYTIAITVDPISGGSATGAGSFYAGTPVTIEATPVLGYEFINWTDASDNVISTTNPYSFNMPIENLAYTANFELIDHTLTVIVNPTIGGSVTGASASYNYNDTVNLIAVPETGYEFLNWTVNGVQVATTTNYSFIMPNENATVTANFIAEGANTYALNLETNPASVATLSGAGTYVEDMVVTVSLSNISPDYQFVNWTNNGVEVSDQMSFAFEMPAEITTLVANFTFMDYSVVVNINPVDAGSVSGEGLFVQNEQVTLTATSNLGYEFVNWTQGTLVLSTDNPYVFAMGTEDIELTANFNEFPKYDVSIVMDPISSGTATGAGSYYEGEEVTVTATAEFGYEFTNWTDASGMVSTNNPYVFTMGAEDMALTANFTALPQYNVSIVMDPISSGTATGAGSYYEGEEVTVTATAEVGFEFTNWTDGSGIVSTDNPYVFTMGAEDVVLTANFTVLDFTLTLEANPSTAGTVSGTGTHAFASMVAINTTATSSDFVFVNWTKGTDVVSTTAAFDYIMPAENVTLVANYQDVTSIANNNIEGVNVYPNPSNGVFNIVAGQEYNMQVVDVTGRLIVAKQIQNGLTILDMGQFNNGVYFIRLISESQIKTTRIIKQQ
ncbi:MAG: T9SS type A sorting domain-containing protein [Bacteroidales bacterium]|nr:T9SS type A sorting domain-containing protein [Bacteroidales bacterium]